MTRPRIYAQLEDDLELGLRLLDSLGAIERRMRARLPDSLAGVDYESEHRAGSVAWCDAHERDVTRCHRRKLLCRGIPLPRVADPAGDLLVHPVYEDAWTMQDAADMLHVAVDRMLAVARRYPDDDPAAKRIVADLEEENRPRCEIHRRYGFVSPARGKHPTAVKHKGQPILDVELVLCEWCEKHVRATYRDRGERRPPNRAEVAQHGRRVGLMPCDPPEPPGDANDVAEYERQRAG